MIPDRISARLPGPASRLGVRDGQVTTVELG